MGTHSYSQYGEDKIIAEILAAAGITTGKLLDIGAWDPVTFSNSRALIERGWAAVIIEPSPRPLVHLLEAYGDNPDVAVIGGAVVPDESATLVKMHITDDAVSTSTEAVYAMWRDTAKYLGFLWTPAVNLKGLWNQFGGFDFVNIDTEGSSVDVALYYLTFGPPPAVLCVEHDGRIVELMAVAQTKGYSVKHANGTNVILAR